MFQSEIKLEFDDFQAVCRGCLSVGRKLTLIGNCKDLPRNFLLQDVFSTSSSLDGFQVCWECISIIKRASQFIKQVKRANEIIQHGENYIYGSLSSLTTVIINYTHPSVVYIQESAQLSLNKNNIECNDNPSNDNSSICPETIDNKHVKDIETDTQIDIEDLKSDIKLESIDKTNVQDDEINKTANAINKNKVKNKLAEKKALQKRTRKFKILSKGDLVIDKYFGRVQLDAETYLDKEGNENFRSDFKYECNICGFTCQRKDDRKTHLEKHTPLVQCLKCEMTFGSKKEFKEHHKDCHEKFVCDHCGVSFKQRHSIERHIRKQHSNFECTPCGKRFARYGGLWLHKKMFHRASDGPPLAPAYCVECDKRFVDVYRYKWHLYNSVKHTVKKKTKVPCPDCNKEFTKNVYMKDHYNLVHLKKFKYRCEECDKNFIRNADLMKHKKRIHEGVMPPKNKICYVCGRGFSTLRILTNHIRTHTGEKPFQCPHCDSAFAQKMALTTHLKAKHKEVPALSIAVPVSRTNLAARESDS